MGARVAIVTVFVIGLLIFIAVVPIVTCPCCRNNPIFKPLCYCCGEAGKITILQYILMYLQYAEEYPHLFQKMTDIARDMNVSY